MAAPLRLIIFCLFLGLTLCAQTVAELHARAAKTTDPRKIYLVGIEFWTREFRGEAVRYFKMAAEKGDMASKSMLENLQASGQLAPGTTQYLYPKGTPSRASVDRSKQTTDSQATIRERWLWLEGSIYLQAGLSRLTDTERTALNNHISSIVRLISTPIQKAPQATPYHGATNEVIETTINGEFHGWDGETVFRLSNGQIWQQVEYDYEYTYDYMPDVLIYKSNSGSWKMQVKDIDHAIEVRRIK